MRLTRSLLASSVGALTLGLAFPVNAQLPYVFTEIANTLGAEFVELGVPSLSENGEVLFHAETGAGGSGLFTGDGTAAPAPYIQDDGGLGAVGSFGDIEGASVVFSAGGNLYRNAPITTLVTSGDSPGFPDINVSGGIAWRGSDIGFYGPRNSLSASFAGLGVFEEFVVASFSPFLATVSGPSLTDANTVGYTTGAYSGATSAVHLAHFQAAAPQTVLRTVERFRIGDLFQIRSPVSANEDGLVAFVRELTSTGVDGLRLRGDGRYAGFLPNFADTAGPYEEFTQVSVNDNGFVVFRAELDAGSAAGLFAGPDAVADAIVQSGDTLLGREALTFAFSERGLNDGGSVAFLVDLYDGFLTVSQHVVRADPIGGVPGAEPGGPYFVDLGEGLDLEAAGSTPIGGIERFEWDLDGDGAPDAESEPPQTGISVPFAQWSSWFEEGRYRIRLRVTYANGFYSIAETTVTVPTECSNGDDDDGDGAVDFGPDQPNPDPDCTSALDYSEEPDCSDGRDNDADGLVDWPADPGCQSASQQIEDPVCDDGQDNDGDVLIDYPDDPDCLQPWQPTEELQRVPALGVPGRLALAAALAIAAWVGRGNGARRSAAR